MEWKFLNVRLESYWYSIQGRLPDEDLRGRPQGLDELLDILCDGFLDEHFGYLLDLNDRQIFDRFHERVRIHHENHYDRSDKDVSWIDDDGLFALYREDIRSMFSDELRRDHYDEVRRNYYDDVRKDLHSRLRERYGDFPLTYPDSRMSSVRRNPVSVDRSKTLDPAVIDEGRALVDEYAELTEKIEALKQRARMLEEKRDEVSRRLYAYSEANVYRTVEGHGCKAEIKVERRVTLPQDKTALIGRLKDTGDYERLSTVNYSRLRSEIAKGEADPVIQRMASIVKVPKIVIKHDPNERWIPGHIVSSGQCLSVSRLHEHEKVGELATES